MVEYLYMVEHTDGAFTLWNNLHAIKQGVKFIKHIFKINSDMNALEIFNYLVFQKDNDKMTLIDLTKEELE